MNTAVGTPGNSSLADPRFATLLEELANKCLAGEPLDWPAYERDYPEHVEELRQLMPAMHAVADLSRSAQAAGTPSADAAEPATGVLGDFRIVREVGRGGMGVVYEAEQISLGRRVALKVLPLAATMDSRHLQRFKNEAQAAAYLQHQNIVPVYYVGCDRGVHYYAMQFIDGHSLAEVIDQLRQERGGRSHDPEATKAYAPTPPAPADGPQNGTATCAQVTRAERTGEAATVSTTPGSGLSRSAYFAWVARLGEQAALALEHAHQQGVLHRDIKPANLMVDGRGNVWVTDFGLAHLPGDQRLTMTGDLLGTLRYMSPEQALAQRVTVDQRTDVYSLGVTLYELLTLQLAYSGKDRQELLRQIAFEEPKTPRRLDKGIPLELETIVLKAMAKAPGEPYATAQELANDLRHWQEDRPIRARRPPIWLRVRRWGRRHRLLVTAATAALLAGLLVTAAAIGWVAKDREAKRAAVSAEITAALTEAQKWQDKGHLPEALSALRRAHGLLAGAAAEPALAEQVQSRLAELKLVNELAAIKLEQATAVSNDNFDNAGPAAAYAQAFRAAGLDVLGAPVEAAARIRASGVAVELAARLDDWAAFKGKQDPEGRKAILRVAWLADPDSWRTQVRQAIAASDTAALQRTAASTDVAHKSPESLSLLGAALLYGKVEPGVVGSFLRAAQRQFPGDFWLNQHLLQFYLTGTQPPRPVDEVGLAMACVSLRPDSPGTRFNLGSALQRAGRLDEAEAECRRAIALKRDYAGAHRLLGIVLADKRRFAEAIAEGAEAVRLNPGSATDHNDLGVLLGRAGRFHEAAEQFRESVRLAHDPAGAALNHTNLGYALRHDGRPQQAIAEFREAIRLNGDWADARLYLGSLLLKQGQAKEAVAQYRAVLHLRKGDPVAHCGLGAGLYAQGLLDEAISECREAIRLKKDYAEAHAKLGDILADKRQVDLAMAEYREAIQLKNDLAEAHWGLARAFQIRGQREEAIAAYREAIRLGTDNLAARYNLGVLLAEKGQLDEAITEFHRAIRLKKEFADAHDDIASAFRHKGRLDAAIVEYREAMRLGKDDAEVHNSLAGCLMERGLFRQAAKEFRLALELGIRAPNVAATSRTWLRQAEEMARLDDRLDDFVAGRTRPKDVSERVSLAWLCQCKHLYATSTRWWKQAFASQPGLADDVNMGHRYNAACAAALAGCGKGTDTAKLALADRAHLRQQALAWLHDDLTAWRQVLYESGSTAGPVIGEQMQHWLTDADLAVVREHQAQAALPPAERLGWEKLWQDVEALRRRATGAPPAATAAGH